MKKLALTTALVLVMGLGAIAQQGQGLLKRGGGASKSGDNITMPVIPNSYGYDGDVDSQNGETGPLGSGVALLLTLGGAYFVAKKRKED